MDRKIPVIEVQMKDFESDFDKYLELAETSDIIVKLGDKMVCILMGLRSFEDSLITNLDLTNPSL
jgi:hypothetical protein